jgi:hypothetical protein
VAIWVLVGVPVALLLLMVWQIGSGVIQSQVGDHSGVGISRINLEPDTDGARVEVVIVDRLGAETSANGEMTIKVREPEGAVWQVTRAVSDTEFHRLPADSLLSGRIGYTLLVPTIDWARPPRHGGAATVSVSFQPTEGPPFQAVAEERFP